jgi:hypothetical protein
MPIEYGIHSKILFIYLFFFINIFRLQQTLENEKNISSKIFTSKQT